MIDIFSCCLSISGCKYLYFAPTTTTCYTTENTELCYFARVTSLDWIMKIVWYCMRTPDWPTIIFPVSPDVASPPPITLYTLAETLFTCSECRMMIDDNSRVKKKMRWGFVHGIMQSQVSANAKDLWLSQTAHFPRGTLKDTAQLQRRSLSLPLPPLSFSLTISLSPLHVRHKKMILQIQGCIICQVYHVLFWIKGLVLHC